MAGEWRAANQQARVSNFRPARGERTSERAPNSGRTRAHERQRQAPRERHSPDGPDWSPSLSLGGRLVAGILRAHFCLYKLEMAAAERKGRPRGASSVESAARELWAPASGP